MLRWRLILGALLVVVLATLCWFDVRAERPGIYLAPFALLLTPLAAREMLGFYRQRNCRPSGWVIYTGTLLPVLASCVPIAWRQYPADCPVGRLGWLAGGLACGLLLALVSEMRRFGAPAANATDGADAPSNAVSSTVNVALAALAILYVGGMMGFFIQLRLLGGGEWDNHGRWGFVAWLSLVVIVKLSDIGQYTAGHAWGRHRMAPTLSPGKTWEGAIGGVAFAIAGALLTLGPVARMLGCQSNCTAVAWFASCVAYGIVIAIAGIAGDLAESMLKRDAGMKDSSSWLPGFGGVLDLLDSLLLAAPVAYACWMLRLVGP